MYLIARDGESLMPTPPVAFLATNDLVGLSRGHAVPHAELESALCSGVGWTPATSHCRPSGRSSLATFSVSAATCGCYPTLLVRQPPFAS
jgi:hypothetical protein